MQQHKALIIVVVLAILIRLPYLNILPPGGADTFFPRLITAISAVISILLLYVVVYKKTSNKSLAIMSASTLTFLPWHIEQSRIYSPFMLVLTVFLLIALLWQIAPCKRCKGVLIVFSGIVLWRLLPAVWIFHPPYTFPSLAEILQNIFKLFSADFLFFNNDSQWFGGLRTIGVFLPSEIIIFLLGIGEIIKGYSKKNIWFVFVSIGFIIVTALDPLFPETRISFLLTPFLAIIAAQGIIYIGKLFQEKKWLAKVLIIFYGIILLYEHILFFHTYTAHYVNRFASDIPYEERVY